MIVYNGRPDDEGGRTAQELRVYDVLDELGIEYIRADHHPAMTMEDCLSVDEALNIHAPKNLFLRNTQKTEFYLLVMPADKKFRTKELSGQLGIARLSFAEEEYLYKYLGVHPGSVSIAGLIHDVEKRVHLVIDRDVYKDEFMGCHPCANTSSIKIKTSELFEKLLPFTGHVPVFVEL